MTLRRPISISSVVIALMMAPGTAFAHVFCVPSVAYPTLQSALDDAGTAGAFNGENNTINIVRGVYSTNGTKFTFHSNDAHKLDVNGGFNADCSTLIKNPALTMLDGGGTSGVFESYSSQGDVSLRYLTFQNGKVNGGQVGGGLLVNYETGGNGPVIVDYNIFRANQGGYAAGLSISTGGSGAIHFDGNLVVDNTAGGDSGGGEIFNYGTGTTYINNNTIARNTVTFDGASKVGGLRIDGSAAVQNFSNNIVYGNSGIDLGSGDAVMVNNDFASNFDTPAFGSTGNVTFDPLFVGDGDFHLAADSPLLAQGTTTPAGGLPTIDLEGHSRLYNSTTSTVDMGAYEHGDEIYDDGFGR